MGALVRDRFLMLFFFELEHRKVCGDQAADAKTSGQAEYDRSEQGETDAFRQRVGCGDPSDHGSENSADDEALK
jgi:hypothetical protein